MYNLYSWHDDFSLLLFDTIDSTNEESKRLATINKHGNFIVCANKQTSGKGRNGRNWLSYNGNLHLSILLRSKFEIALAMQIPFVTALATCDFVSKFAKYPDKVKIKWPNDILYDKKKIAGILIESKLSENNSCLEWLVIGCGINLVVAPMINYDTTHIKEISGVEVNTTEAIGIYMQYLTSYIQTWQSNGFEYIRQKWIEKSFGQGLPITVATERSRISGIYQNIDQNGSIVIKLASGGEISISSGEVFFETNNFANITNIL